MKKAVLSVTLAAVSFAMAAEWNFPGPIFTGGQQETEILAFNEDDTHFFGRKLPAAIDTDFAFTLPVGTVPAAGTAARFGGLDVLVNNAAYGGGSGGKSCEFRLDKIDDDTWNTGIDGTLGVAFRCTRAVIPLLEERGGGAIVNVGSMYGLVAPDFAIYGDDMPWNPPSYGAGKAGLIQFTRYCAAALAPKKIRVNALTPGPFPNVTPQTDAGFIERLSNKTMLRRTGRLEEISGALILLCSDASSFMTGSNIVVDGGMTSW